MRMLRFLVVAVVVAALGPTISTSPAQAATAPSNDRISRPKTISTFPYTDTAKISGATKTSDEPNDDCNRAKTVWYVLTPPKAAGYTFSTRGSTYDTLITIYDGKPAAGGPNNAPNKVFCYDISTASVALRKGHTYYIGVSSWGSGGTLTFNTYGPNTIGIQLKRSVLNSPGTSASGGPGVIFNLSVQGFTTDEFFTAYYIRNGTKMQLNEGSAKYDGTGDTAVYVPRAPKGTYSVRVEQTWIVKTTTMTVSPRVWLDQPNAHRGLGVTFGIGGFAPNETVSIKWWDGQTWRTVKPDGASSSKVTLSIDGYASVRIKVPDWAPLGTVKVRAIGSENSVSGDPFELLPSLSASSSIQRTPTATATAVRAEPTAESTSSAAPGIDEPITDPTAAAAPIEEAPTAESTATSEPVVDEPTAEPTVEATEVPIEQVPTAEPTNAVTVEPPAEDPIDPQTPETPEPAS